MEFATIKGFRDILPDEIPYWHTLENEARRLFECYGFQEIRTPILEKTELFNRSIGQETDIVSKEMYTFQDSKGRNLSLRPEATASVVRAYIQNRLYTRGGAQKFYCIGPMFRHERPQKGRFRQFHQINVEEFGDPGPVSDAELIIMIMSLFERIGLRNGVRLNINSLGCLECRSVFKDKLKEYLRDKKEIFCPDCQRRAVLNPLRVFDCKVESCQQGIKNAPIILNYLCDSCKAHFHHVQEILSDFDVEFLVNPRLVRGLDYYTRTTFEVHTDELGAQNAIAGGGRYDGLVRLLGGPEHPAIGFAIGVERTINLLQKKRPIEKRGPDIFIAALGEKAKKISFSWVIWLRDKGLWVEMEHEDKGLKAQMKKADKMRARKVLIIGENELLSKKAALRDMKTGEQEEIKIDNVEYIYNAVLTP